jgi:hypothetical protein
VNKALFFLCTESPENITLLLEQGIASRVRDLCDKSETRELSAKVLASMLRSPTPFHRRILLSDRFRGIIAVLITEMINASSDDTRYHGFYPSSSSSLLSLSSLLILELKYVQDYALSLLPITST